MRQGALLLVGAVFFPALALAQALNFDTGSLSLTLLPEHPAAGQSVTITAKTFDLGAAKISWTVDGAPHGSGGSITVTAPALGAETSVRALASDESGLRASASATLRPAEVDLVWESDAYVPPFFKGRALPSAGSSLRLQAVPRFKVGKATLPESDITFTWRRNGYVIPGVSGVGRSIALIDAPALFGADTISVDAQTADGITASASAYVPSRQPLLVLYENHPLFGLMYHRPFGTQTSIGEGEVTFAAVPYYASAFSPRDPELQYEWRVNSQDVPGPSGNEITVNAQNSNGLALIELTLTAVQNFFLSAYGSWGVVLTGAGSASAANPFGGSFQ